MGQCTVAADSWLGRRVWQWRTGVDSYHHRCRKAVVVDVLYSEVEQVS